MVTTEDFKIKNKETGNYLKEEAMRRIFPANPITGMFIDFVRLRPSIGETIEGEEIQLTCEFSIKTAKENAMYNVASKCAYAFTLDEDKAITTIETLKKQWQSEGLTQDEIVFNTNNYKLLDVQRQYIENSYDFAVQTVGVYSNEQLVKKGAIILHNKFIDFVKLIDENQVPIVKSETTTENSYDIVLENEDYTMGKILEYIMYDTYYMKEPLLSFCGFKKLHPHNTSSIIRVAFVNKSEKSDVLPLLRKSAIDAGAVFNKIAEMFK
jgi:DNA-directed RNA polymerase subunit L